MFAEATETQLNAMKNTTYLPNDDINVVVANSWKKPSGNDLTKTGGGGGGQASIECRYSGRQYNRGRKNCPAFGKQCSKCGKMIHFASKCLSSRKSAINVLQVNKNEVYYRYGVTTRGKRKHYARNTKQRHGKDFCYNELDAQL